MLVGTLEMEEMGEQEAAWEVMQQLGVVVVAGEPVATRARTLRVGVGWEVSEREQREAVALLSIWEVGAGVVGRMVTR